MASESLQAAIRKLEPERDKAIALLREVLAARASAPVIQKVREFLNDLDRPPPAPEPPHCPKCGYSEEDAQFHMDHHLCDGEIPPAPERSPSESVRDVVMEMVEDDGVWNSIHHCAYRNRLCAAVAGEPESAWLHTQKQRNQWKARAETAEKIARDYEERLDAQLQVTADLRERALNSEMGEKVSDREVQRLAQENAELKARVARLDCSEPDGTLHCSVHDNPCEKCQSNQENRDRIAELEAARDRSHKRYQEANYRANRLAQENAELRERLKVPEGCHDCGCNPCECERGGGEA